MTRTAAVLILAAGCILQGRALALLQPRPATSDAVQQVLVVDDARRMAMLHSDVKALDALLAEDVIIFWGDGTTDDKASTLELFRSGRLRYSKLDYDNTRVRIYGDTAVVTGNARVQAQADDHPIQHLVRVTRVYVNQHGQWRLVASQTTRVAETSAP